MLLTDFLFLKYIAAQLIANLELSNKQFRLNMVKLSKKKYLLPIIILCILMGLIPVLFIECAGKKEVLTIVFVGDLMLDRGTRNITAVKGVDDYFESVHNAISSSDFTVANLECVACDTTCKPLDKTFTFRANPEWISSLYKNGITHLVVANNHSFDFGARGMKQTIFNLLFSGIKPIGYSQNNDATSTPTLLNKGNDSVAIFSSCLLKQNNRFVSSENTTSLSEKISVFKLKHPTYIILVCLHWGVEMNTLPTKEQILQAHQLIRAGADAIIGHHPHVVQPIEVYKGKYIFYSLGNFIFDNHHSPANRGVMAKLCLSKRSIAVQVLPFNIIKSKPILMKREDSEDFRKEISLVSKTIDLKQQNGIWEVF